MKELKTLKDIKEERLKPVGRKDVKISANRIKAEAVNEYKILNDELLRNQVFPFGELIEEESEAIKKYIKWKFNLTEEDLE